MKKLIMLSTLIFMGAIGFYGCQDLVNDVDGDIDTITNEQLNSESQVQFLVNGLLTRFATTHDRLALQAGGLSDEEVFDQNVPNATFPTFRDIDDGLITFDNNSVDGVYNDLGELRFFSDDLVQRINEDIEFGDSEESQALRASGLYNAYFFAGTARYFFAVYFGLDETTGGGIIDGGPFIPSEQMFGLALEQLNLALDQVASDSREARIVNTLIGRIQLLQGNFSAADATLDNALEPGDASFSSQHSVESANEWWGNGGLGRTQFVADDRFREIIRNEPAEANRIPLDSVLANDESRFFFSQGLYPEQGTPLTFLSWQEVNLMEAEIDLDAVPNSPTALALINEVRASSDIPPRLTADMDDLIEEREREFFTQGLRLIDQRRFDIFHLPAGRFQYLPITQSERNQNENL
jgi:hypothetical protein